MLFQKLKRLRINEGLSQEELAEKLHLSPNTISNIETGKKQHLDIGLLQLYSDFFKLPLSDLVDNDNVTMNFHDRVENGYIHHINTLNQDNKVMLDILRIQLVEKDKQLAEKDRHIQLLLSREIRQ